MSYDTTNWRTDKLITLDEAANIAADLKAQGKRLVTANGSFDLLHAGHLDQLEEAKKQGDSLFVGVNSDASVRDGKGPTRPFIAEQPRAALLAALACTDYVVIVDEPYDHLAQIFLRAIKPHVHVNGPDYGEPKSWLEWPVMQELDIAGHVVQKSNDLSTSDVVKKISNATE